MSFKKIQIIKHVFLLPTNIGYGVLLMLFHIFYSYFKFQIYS